jgi:hypothetical protein
MSGNYLDQIKHFATHKFQVFQGKHIFKPINSNIGENKAIS